MVLAYLSLPSLDFELEVNGKRGWNATFYSHEDDNSLKPQDKPFFERYIDETRVFFSVDKPKGLTHRWSMTLEGQLKPRERDCKFEFGLSVAGRAKVGLSIRDIELVSCCCSCSLTISSSSTTGRASAGVTPSSALALARSAVVSRSRPASRPRSASST
jgi:hypothetical protein